MDGIIWKFSKNIWFGRDRSLKGEHIKNKDILQRGILMGNIMKDKHVDARLTWPEPLFWLFAAAACAFVWAITPLAKIILKLNSIIFTKTFCFGNHPTTLAGSFNLWFSQNNTKTVVLRIMCPPPRGKDYNYWFFLGIPGVHWVERHLDVLFLKLANYHHIIFKILLLFLFYRCSSLSCCWQALMLLLLACVKSKSHPSCFIWNLKCPLILENIERTDVRGDT